MTSDRYVSTRAIRDAVKGRELEVLEAVGVFWDDGADHITCPYPDHTDSNPSWRWNPKRQRAHCTCIERSHSIFDVVMRRENIDFEAAKLRVAEILGRQDLIKIKDGQRHQAMDAASLLRPPADQRDDQLAQAYPAFRLGVPPDEVPMPSTPVAGWRGLAYYDPPAKKGGKPKLVGHFPCVVFGTVAPDARRHAHRIYVAPGGQGKAALGTRSDGRPRDPKKSAKLRDGQSAAGCAVLWGAPAIAPHLVLAEGIETAAALAFAHRAEIEANELAIAAALSASGISLFEPWPATRRVTVAADRDERHPADDRGHCAGERAAREFALRHHEQLEVQIALPGQPGEDADWLDVLRREGLKAVRVGLQAAPSYAPTSRESEDARQHASRAAELAEIERTYPLPAMESLSLAYQHTRTGKIMVHKYAGKDEEKNDIWLPIATPLGVPARLRAVDQQGAYGLRVTVRGMDGQPRVVEFDRAGLARMGASEIRAHLFAAGLRVEHDGEVVAVQALKAADPSVEIVVVSRPGWHRLPELTDPVFITPGSEVLAHLMTVRWSLRPMRASPIPSRPAPWRAGAPPLRRRSPRPIAPTG
ncbi:MAG TPA: toprim domain-containing protein [Geminicoccaceae bacterium]|nr:toprim domain-containing protein [Geminicoccaceae bacterium]